MSVRAKRWWDVFVEWGVQLAFVWLVAVALAGIGVAKLLGH